MPLEIALQPQHALGRALRQQHIKLAQLPCFSPYQVTAVYRIEITSKQYDGLRFVHKTKFQT
jgi:hypothetical protein